MRRFGDGQSPKKALATSVAWFLISILFLDTGWGRVTGLRAAGKYVNPWRYGNVVFWIFLIIFWGWNIWNNWRRYRLDEKVV